FVTGLPVRLGRLTDGRGARMLDRTSYTAERDAEAPGQSAWLVNGTRARPANAPEPRHLGPGPAQPLTRHAAAGETHSPRNGPAPSPSRNGNGTLNGHHPAPPRIGTIEPAAGADRVMEAFQKTMQTFLDVQRETMLALLGQSTTVPLEPEPFAVEHTIIP